MYGRKEGVDMKTEYEFTVTGIASTFPRDMIEYDRCSPKTDEDVEKLNRALTSNDRTSVTITFISDKKPTSWRWMTHNWYCYVNKIIGDTSMTKEEFTRMVNSHDLTYGYSDDPGVYRAGSDSHTAIVQASKAFDPEFVNEVWNAMVLRKIKPEYAGPFLNLVR